MNFLGHLYFSRNDTELMTANLFGDFVKGKDFSHYSSVNQQGIRLHRNIDYYIDNHPAVIELLHQLYASLPKIAGIAVDLYFDHLLAKNWKLYHPEELQRFISNYHQSIDLNDPDFTQEFRFMLSKMIEKNWLLHYQFKEGLHKACQGVSRRISFQNELINGLAVFEQFEKQIESTFEIYMNDANVYLNRLELT